jgi:ketosteroid isomerase-like protein
VAKTPESNKAILERVLKAYSEGDVAPLREAADPSVVYHSHAAKEIFRFGGRHEGFANAVAAMSSIASGYAIHSYRIRELIGDGDIVWSLADVEATERRKKRQVKMTLAARWQFRDGRIVFVEDYFDSARMALEQGLVTALR